MRTTRIGLTLTLVALAGVAATSTLVSASPAAPGSPMERATPNSVPVPDGYKRVVDDTATITMAVPESWAVITTPRQFEGFPTIQAGPAVNPPACEGCEPYTDLPSVRFLATPYEEVPVPGESCGGTGVLPFDNGRFTGSRANGVGCDADVDDVEASHNGGAFTAHLSFIYSSVDEVPAIPKEDAQAIFDVMLSTIDWTGNPYPDVELPESPPSGDLPAATAVQGQSLWPYAEFRDVPQLGTEPVRGSGCGSEGQIDDVIPDGLWAGYASVGAGSAVSIDLLCVFYGKSAQVALDSETANVLHDDPDFLVVNNNERERTVPSADGMVLRGSQVASDGTCVEGDPNVTPDPNSGNQTWIRIHNGEVTWVLYGCGPFGAATGSAPTPSGNSNLPPALPSEGPVWPYGPFWNVPRLGTEPVRGSGCDSQGEIGDVLPDGLWAGYLSYDGATDRLWVDVVCVFYGESAQAIIAEGTANIVNNEPDYLVVNNSDRRREIPNNLQAIGKTALDGNGQCVENGWSYPGPGAHIQPPTEVDLYGHSQAWIRIHDGAVTWIIYGCDSGYQPGG